MTPQIRYQVFVSSTYEDLREERQQATQAILEAGFFPSGMELFPASDDTQWDLIKRVIEECDYYLVVVGGRYGSIGSSGLSYTEMEYDYAVEVGIPVLGFVRANLGEVSAKHTERTEEGRAKLAAFRDKVMKRTCRKYNDPSELGMAVMKSLMHEARVRPRIGWVRADQARTAEDRQRESKLLNDLKEAEVLIEQLEREIRDRAVLADDVPRDLLAQGEDIFDFSVIYRDDNKQYVSSIVSVSWDEIFRTIGPSLYGYIQTKHADYGQIPRYSFQDDLEHHLRSKIIDRVQNRKIEIEAGQIDACVFQLKELGLLMFKEQDSENGVFRGVTLTEHGERELSLLKIRRRVSD